MDFIRFFDDKDWKKLVRSANALASRIQGSVADGITGLESRVEDLEDRVPTLGTPQATTSGVAWDFPVPSWATEVQIPISGFQTNGTSIPMIQLKGSGAFEATGYSGAAANILDAGSGVVANNSTGFLIAGVWAATRIFHGTVTLTLLNSSTNKWTMSVSAGLSDTARVQWGGGSKTITGALTEVRLTTVTGVNTGVAGEVNTRSS